MCSILGILDIKSEPQELREQALRMSKLQRHRGPDWSGIYNSKQAILAHERLAIVDPESGINLHDMPKDRIRPDLHHWLGLDAAFLTDPCSKPSCQNYCFHRITPYGLPVMAAVSAETQKLLISAY